MRFTYALVMIAILGCIQSTVAQEKRSHKTTLGWDLTYKSVLKSNKVKSTEFIWTGPGEKYVSPVLQLLRNWHGPAITSSILIEFPAGHGDAHGVLWLV